MKSTLLAWLIVICNIHSGIATNEEVSISLNSSTRDSIDYYIKETIKSIPISIDTAQYYSNLLLNFSQQLHDEGSLKADIYFVVAEVLSETSHADSALYYLNQADTICHRINDLKRIAKTQLTKAICYRILRDKENAIIHLEKAAMSYTQIKDSLGMSRVYGSLSNLYQNTGNLQLALKYMNRSISILKDLNSSDANVIEMKYRHNLSIGIIYGMQGENALSYSSFKQSLLLGQQLGISEWIADATTNIAILFYFQGKYDSALHYYYNALQIQQQRSDPEAIASVSSDIALVYKDQGDYKNAIDYQTKALGSYRDINDQVGEAKVMVNMAQLYKSIGLYDKAIQSYNKSIQLYELANHHEGIAINYNGLAGIYNGIDSSNTAISYYKMALATFRRIGLDMHIAQTLFDMSQVYLKQDSSKIALPLINEAFQMSKENNYLPIVASCLLSLGKLSKIQEKLQDAEQKILESLNINNQIQNPKGVASCYMALGDLYESIDNKIALQYLQKAEMHIPLSDIMLHKLYYQRASIYEKQEKFHLAVINYKRAMRLKKNSVNAQNINKVNELNAQIQLMNHEKEIAHLNSTSEIEIVKRKRYLSIIQLMVTGVLGFIFILVFIQIKQRLHQQLKSRQKLHALESESLKSLINPHFLYNALNSLQHLIYQSKFTEGQSYLARLNGLLSKIISTPDHPSESLEDTIESIKDYIEIEKLTLGKPLEYRVDVSADIETKKIQIPQLIVQPYIENCFKHGFKLSNAEINQLHIAFKLNKEQIICTIKDNGIGIRKSRKMQLASNSSKEISGTTVTHDRLKVLEKKYNQRIDVSTIDLKEKNENGTLVNLSIPIIKELRIDA